MLDALGPYLLEDVPENDLPEDARGRRGVAGVKGYPHVIRRHVPAARRRRREGRERRDPADPAGLRPGTPRSARRRRSAAPSSTPCTTRLTDGKPIGLDFVYGEVERRDVRAARRAAAAHHAVSAALVPRIPQRPPRRTAAMDRASRTRRVRARDCSASASSSTRRPRTCRDARRHGSRTRAGTCTCGGSTRRSRPMLVMLDAIADRFDDDDLDAAWERLTDEAEPAVWFQLLPDRRDGLRARTSTSR